jgi:hypothetical protein
MCLAGSCVDHDGTLLGLMIVIAVRGCPEHNAEG